MDLFKIFDISSNLTGLIVMLKTHMTSTMEVFS